MKILIKNAKIINEGKIIKSDLLISNDIIREVSKKISPNGDEKIIDIEGCYLLPGLIDDQVHFREPGLTHKGTIYSESKAAVAGGVTSFFEMPNTKPQTTTIEELKNKFDLASKNSFSNYSFMFGGTNKNLSEIKKLDFSEIPAIKLFLGSSTGNMLIDDYDIIEKIFNYSKVPVVVHSEDEEIIKKNLKTYKEQFGDKIPFEYHSKIRSEESCFKSTERIINLAKKTNSRLHVFHLSTKLESKLFSRDIPLKNKKITSEVCIHHLSFDDNDYKTKKGFIKWNPSVKSKDDQNGLWESLNDGRIDVVATDHAPHTYEEKNNNYINCPSGGPLVQHSLNVMFEHYLSKKISLEKIVEKMCHNPAILFRIQNRGYIRKNYYADLVVLDPNKDYKVDKSNILYKCGWSPFEGKKFNSVITHTFVNGNLVYENGKFNESFRGSKITFQ